MHWNIRRFTVAKVLGMAVGMSVCLVANNAQAEWTIEQPNAHPQYFAELEPHLTLGWFSPPGPGSGSGWGAGFLASFEIVDPGFIGGLNNTVAIAVGFDMLNYGYEGEGNALYAWIPVVMQWNFHIAKEWSVMGEPGIALRFQAHASDTVDPLILRLGARWHFAENMSLTMRIGYPTASVGLSFLL